MKRLKITIILSVFVAAQLCAQKKYKTTYEVQYEVSYSIDSTHLDKKTNETVYLYTSLDQGVFMSYPKAKADEIDAKIKRQIKAGKPITVGSDMQTNFNKTFYKNLQTDTVKTVENIGRKPFVYKEPKTPNWQIADSTKTFRGHTVRKAMTGFAGRDYVAWFTTEIPIHDGPYLFAGLPGLIVELYDTQNDYHFKLNSIEKLDKPKSWTVPEAESIGKAKFKKLKAKATQNVPSDQLKMGGITVQFTGQPKDGEGRELSPAEIRRMNRKEQQQKNNPIELK